MGRYRLRRASTGRGMNFMEMVSITFPRTRVHPRLPTANDTLGRCYVTYNIRAFPFYDKRDPTADDTTRRDRFRALATDDRATSSQ